MSFAASVRPTDENDFGFLFMDAEGVPASNGHLQLSFEEGVVFLSEDDARRLYLMLRAHFAPIEDIEAHLKEALR